MASRFVYMLLKRDRNGVMQYDSQYSTAAAAGKMKKKLQGVTGQYEVRKVDLSRVYLADDGSDG